MGNKYSFTAFEYATATTGDLPGAGQIYQCLKKEPLCSAWCHLPHHLPPYLFQCPMSCLAVVRVKQKYENGNMTTLLKKKDPDDAHQEGIDAGSHGFEA